MPAIELPQGHPPRQHPLVQVQGEDGEQHGGALGEGGEGGRWEDMLAVYSLMCKHKTFTTHLYHMLLLRVIILFYLWTGFN